MQNGENFASFLDLIVKIRSHSGLLNFIFIFLQYGFIHCALADLVIGKFGEDAWKSVM